MNKEIELLPAGLITCLLNNREVRILKISPKKLTVRLADKIEDINEFKIAFHIFDESRYEEIIINKYDLIEEKKEDFYLLYTFNIYDEEYLQNVRFAFKNYSRYMMLKAYSDDNDFSKEMVNYPSEEDYDFYKYHSIEKENWMKNLNYKDFDENIINNIEFAINIDNSTLYEKYLEEDIKLFKINYLKDNYIENHKLFKKDISRVYFGNEFCHNLFPNAKILIDMINKAKKESLEITICFTYIREDYIEKTKNIIEDLYNWCRENNEKIEIVINDWGMIKLVKDKIDYFTLSLGILLNKRKKDPRYIYKKDYIGNEGKIGENNLNSNVFGEFLKEKHIERYEYEGCGYRVNIPKGNHSIHLPFYVTNTSQYCTLYAMCTKLARGKQSLAKGCPQYCKDYVFTYPKHLKMVGRYNSIFAFDDTLLKDSKELEYYIKQGIDRVVLNFI